MDVGWHGTAVASLIAGTGPVRGTAPNATLLPIQAQTTPAVVDAIYEAVDAGAQVINISQSAACYQFEEGTRFTLFKTVAEYAQLRVPCDLFTNAVDYAENNGVVVVAAAGNDGGRAPECSEVGRVDDVPSTPATLPHTIGVSAMDPNGLDWACSTRGGAATMAPGSWLQVAAPDHEIGVTEGSSLASPLVAGILARVIAAYPAMTPAQLRALVAAASSPPGGTINPTGVANRFSVELMLQHLDLVEPGPFTDWATQQQLVRTKGLQMAVVSTLPFPDACNTFWNAFPDPDDVVHGQTGRTVDQAGQSLEEGSTEFLAEANTDWVFNAAMIQTSCTRIRGSNSWVNPATNTGVGELVLGGAGPVPPVAGRDSVVPITDFRGTWARANWVYCASGSPG